MDVKEQLKRWRLILGSECEQDFACFGMSELSQEQILLDNALAQIYGLDQNDSYDFGHKGSKDAKSKPNLSKWLGDLNKLFDKDIISIIQNDAIEKKGLKQLLLEKELLEQVVPDLNMASTLLMLKDQIPSKSKDAARAFIRKIVEQINKNMQQDIQRSVSAALNKKQHSPIATASAIDFKYTIAKNLKHYNQDLQTIIPQKVYFFDRQVKVNKWHIILDIDQSGSMGETIIYSSIMSCILASMSSLKTNVVAFDTKVMDLTPLCSDPVDLLYGFQMGGGTDIAKSLAYCRQFIQTPNKTLFFLISDLEEGGNRAALLEHLQQIKDSGVYVIVLLAVSDLAKKPYYDQTTAKKIAAMHIPCLACSPQKLPLLLESALKKHDLTQFK